MKFLVFGFNCIRPCFFEATRYSDLARRDCASTCHTSGREAGPFCSFGSLRFSLDPFSLYVKLYVQRLQDPCVLTTIANDRK